MELNEQIVGCMKTGKVDTEYQARINSLDFHRVHDLLVTAADDDSIKLYGLETGNVHKMLHSKKYGIAHVRFTHHHESIVFASNKEGQGGDHALRYLSVHDNKFKRYLKGHTQMVTSLSVAPKNDLIMSTSQDRTMRLWDLRVQNAQGLLEVPSGVPVAAFDQQGLVLCVGVESGIIKLYDLRSYDKGPFSTFTIEAEVNKPNSFSQLKFSPNGKIMVGVVGSKIHQIDAYNGAYQFAHSTGIPDGATPLQSCFSPDNKFLLSGHEDKSIRVWNTVSGQQVAQWDSNPNLGHGHITPPTCIDWAPRRVLVASGCHLLNMWIPAVDDLKLLGLVS